MFSIANHVQVSDSPHGNLTYGMQKGKEQFMLFTVFFLAWFLFQTINTHIQAIDTR